VNAEAQALVIAPAEHDRRRYLGGSDIAAVLGISPWRTPVAVWERKTAEVPDEPEAAGKRRIFKRGHRWESVVAEMLTERLQAEGHKVEIIGTNRRFVDAVHGMFAAEIDYEIRLDDEDDVTNVELKTVHPFAAGDWGESGSDDLPLHYTAQAMWGLGVAPGYRKRCIVAPLFGADEIRVYEVPRDDATIEAMRTRALDFWNNYVLARVPPPPISLDDLARLFPADIEARGALIADMDLKLEVLRLRAIRAEIKARESEGEVIEFKLKSAMGECGELVVDDKAVVTWKSRPWSSLDQTGLKEAHPKIHKEFVRKGSSRTFIVK
jgi:putative phage-type endonuclease